MAEVKEGAYFIALQFASHQIESLEKELKIFYELLNSALDIEKAHMISIESSDQARLFQIYKGKIEKLKNFKRIEKKKDGKVFR